MVYLMESNEIVLKSSLGMVYLMKSKIIFVISMISLKNYYVLMAPRQNAQFPRKKSTFELH